MTTPLSLEEFKSGLTPQHIMTQMIIHAALAAGPLIFLFVVWTVHSQSEPLPPTAEYLEFLQLMTVIHVVFFVGAAGLSQVIWNVRLKQFSSKVHLLRENPPTPAARIESTVAIIREIMIIQTALLEGGAFVGVAVLMIAAQSGALHSYDWMWMNGLSTLLLVGYVAATFPSRDRFASIYSMMLEQP